MPISAIESISLAVEHTKQQLFRPFRFGQWTRLAVVGLLAGELSSGGCNSFNLNRPMPAGGSRHGIFPALAGVDLALLGGIIAVLIVTAVVLGLLLMYISSVMRFVLFDSIVAKECQIRQSWNVRQGPGWRYFLWKLLYLLFGLGGMAVLLGIPAGLAFAAGWFNQPKEHLVPLILGGILVLFAALFFSLAIAVIFVLTKDFVIPQMALENIGAIEGWSRLWRMMGAEKGGYAAYIGMKIVMAIAAGIVVGIATLILGFMIAVPTIGLSIVAIITGKNAGLTWNAYTITVAIVVGSILLLIFFYLVALISVPVIVFFPAYSIYFFAGRYPALSAVLYPAPAGTQRAAGTIPPYEPPLPSAPAPVGG